MKTLRVISLVFLLVTGTVLARGGEFRPHVDYATGANPVAVAAGDLDSDGIADLVVANSVDNTVSILLGNGDGTFRSHVDYPTGTQPYSMVVGDLNGDGKLDLATANWQFAGNVSVLLGNGDGTFQTHVDYVTGPDPISIALADLNNDGIPDLVTADFVSSISILIGNGDGSFQTPIHYLTPTGPRSVAVADFNSDGNADLAVAIFGSDGASSEVSVLMGRGDGTFLNQREHFVGVGPISVAEADLNLDGHPDIVTANSGFGASSVSVLLGNGDGSFGPHTDYLSGRFPLSAAVADANGDSHPDLISANGGSATISVLIGNGDGSFQPPAVYGIGAGPQAVASADFNRDGAVDLAVAVPGSNTVNVTLNNGGTRMKGSSSPNPSTFGQTVTFIVFIAPSFAGTPAPTGTITWTEGSTTLATVELQDGQAQFSTASLSRGAHAIAAAYSGDAKYNPNPGVTLSQVVE